MGHIWGKTAHFIAFYRIQIQVCNKQKNGVPTTFRLSMIIYRSQHACYFLYGAVGGS